MRKVPARSKQPTSASDLLWKAAGILRGSMDTAHYKSTVLTLLYVRLLSTEFEQGRRHTEVEGLDDTNFHCAAEGLRWVPEVARWKTLFQRVQDPDDDPVSALDEAFRAIERSGRDFADLFPPARALIRDMERPSITALFALFDDAIDGTVAGELLEGLARLEGKKGSAFHTPRSVSRLLVEVLQPRQGRVYDPCCGSGSMLVQATRFAVERGVDVSKIACYGQEINAQSWRLARMNLHMQGLDANLGCGDTLADDLWPTFKADVVVANPPFNITDWTRPGRERRWPYGPPPRNNANFAWLQHVVDKLDVGGSAGVVLANGSLSTRQMGEGEIRKGIVEDDLIACIVALPAHLFPSTAIPACVWFLSRGKSPQGAGLPEDRRGQTLFIDAQGMGVMTGRAHRVLTDEELSEIADTYHAWRGAGRRGGCYRDVPGFCRSVQLEEIRQNQHVLTPARYVGQTEADGTRPGGSTDVRIRALTRELLELMDASDRLTQEMRHHLSQE
ncbi:type I restriction-modification system subunit M [Streptomyces sp. NPDC000229]|uniref:type I restriction-modification system subunit M n=1 Tax=Streptomyces sp. NPDC000229 TaxID=3154247 RepID=UPI0033238796